MSSKSNSKVNIIKQSPIARLVLTQHGETSQHPFADLTELALAVKSDLFNKNNPKVTRIVVIPLDEHDRPYGVCVCYIEDNDDYFLPINEILSVVIASGCHTFYIAESWVGEIDIERQTIYRATTSKKLISGILNLQLKDYVLVANDADFISLNEKGYLTPCNGDNIYCC